MPTSDAAHKVTAGKLCGCYLALHYNSIGLATPYYEAGRAANES